MMQCPQCGSRDLRVSALICCEIVQTTVSGVEHDIAEIIEPPEIYWDGDSWVSCQGSACCFEAAAKAFATTEPIERKGGGS